MELNRVERRALLTATALVVLGTGVRLGFGPGEATYAWRPAPGSGGERDSTRAAVDRAVVRAERVALPLAAGEKVDPNSAPAEELERLPGIGPQKARAIIEARPTGGFRTLADLERVPGIGPVLLERLAPYLTLKPQAAGGGATNAPSVTGLAPLGNGGDRIDLNRAGSQELQTLPGIGPSRARAIIETRQRLGRFRHLEDLERVPGIGPAIVARLRDRAVAR